MFSCSVTEASVPLSTVQNRYLQFSKEDISAVMSRPFTLVNVCFSQPGFILDEKGSFSFAATAVISVAPCLADNGEHNALYKTNSNAY